MVEEKEPYCDHGPFDACRCLIDDKKESQVAKHYTAVVEVFEVQQVIGTRDASGGKDKSEVARIVVRADTLDELRDKVGKHIELI